MSAYDFEISKSIWNGKIPLKLTLDEHEDYGNWEPIFLEIPRCSYLPLITKQVQKILIGLGLNITEEAFQSVWYDYNKQPLKWHYPIGLLFDLYSTAENLPWTLTLHFNDLPSDVILLKPTVDNMQDMFMSMIKEADFLRNGSTKKVMNLSKKDSTQIWQSLVTDQYDDFYAVNKQLMDNLTQVRNVPFKIYLPDNCPVIQELIAFNTEETIGDVIYKVIPEIRNLSVLIVIHGIEIPLDTPIHWAYENLIFADSFLHIVIK